MPRPGPGDPVGELNGLLASAISQRRYDGITLSGGIDSSIVAYHASGRTMIAVTMALQGSGASDIYYSGIVAQRLGIRHTVCTFTLDEAEEAAREVVKIMKTFDHIEIRNDITLYLALRLLKEQGATSILTGDGGDELFAGYPYMVRMPPEALRRHITDGVGRWRFPSSDLGAAIGLEVHSPLLSEGVVGFALNLPHRWRINARGGTTYGKWILRQALDRVSLGEVAWRSKAPIEEGSGSAAVSRALNDSMGPEAEAVREEAAEEGVRFWDPDQSYFYRLYKEVVGSIPRGGEFPCRCCGSARRDARAVCTTCGYAMPAQGVMP